MNCKMCNAEFEPSKKDERIVFCSRLCRIKFRNESNYMPKYYTANIDRWRERQKTKEFKDAKNVKRNNKYRSRDRFLCVEQASHFRAGRCVLWRLWPGRHISL